MASVLRVTQSQRAEMIGLYHTELGAEGIAQEVAVMDRARGNDSSWDDKPGPLVF